MCASSELGEFISKRNREITLKAQYSYCDYNNTETQVQDIIDLIWTKTELEKINSLTEKILQEAPKAYSKVLFLRYHRQLPCSKVAKILNVSERTVFRRLEKALDWLATQIDKHPFLNNLQNLLSKKREAA